MQCNVILRLQESTKQTIEKKKSILCFKESHKDLEQHWLNK